MTEEHDQDNLEHDPTPMEPAEGEATNTGEGEVTEQADQTPDHRDRRDGDTANKPAPTPKADAGLKPQRSATKAGKGKAGKKSTYNPGKTPPKPIELKDHSPWYIPWLGTGLIVIFLLILIAYYLLGGLPPFNSWWIVICFVGMTAGLIVLSRWK